MSKSMRAAEIGRWYQDRRLKIRVQAVAGAQGEGRVTVLCNDIAVVIWLRELAEV